MGESVPESTWDGVSEARPDCSVGVGAGATRIVGTVAASGRGEGGGGFVWACDGAVDDAAMLAGSTEGDTAGTVPDAAAAATAGGLSTAGAATGTGSCPWTPVTGDIATEDMEPRPGVEGWGR